MYHIVMFDYQNLKMMLFSHVLVIFTVIQNKCLALSNRNAILNNFEEYYILSSPFLSSFLNWSKELCIEVMLPDPCLLWYHIFFMFI